MDIVLVEALTFGLGRLVNASEKFHVTLHLLTYNKEIYFYELSKINSKNLVLVEIDTFNNEAIISYCKKLKHLIGIINLTDTWTNRVQEIAAILGYKGQNPLSTEICRDKSKLRAVLAEKKLTKGRSWLIDINNINEIPDIVFPVILKDPAGTGSKNVWFADNNDDFQHVVEVIKAAGNLAMVLVETYFKGTLYSAETISFKGETKLIAVSSRVLSDMPFFMEKAISLPLNTDNTELSGVDAWIKNILSAISYTDGFAHTEFIITANGFEVVEINPRLAGAQIGEALCQAYNYNIYQALIEMCMGIKPEIFTVKLQPDKYTAQVLIYANKNGLFREINQKHINTTQTVIYPCALPGKNISSLTDQSACVGILLTTGDSSEIALLNAFSEANKISVIMEPADD